MKDKFAVTHNPIFDLIINTHLSEMAGCQASSPTKAFKTATQKTKEKSIN
jgi:hypothetical protein